MTGDTHIGQHIKVRGARIDVPRKNILSYLPAVEQALMFPHSVIIIDMSSILRGVAQRPDMVARMTWADILAAIHKVISWATAAGCQYVIFVCDDRLHYPQQRKDAVLVERATEREKKRYDSLVGLDSMTTPHGHPVRVNLDMLLNTDGGHDLAMRMFLQEYHISCVVVRDRAAPVLTPNRSGDDSVPAYFQNDATLVSLFPHLSRVNLSECDVVLPLLAKLHLEHYGGDCARILICRDTDITLSCASNNDHGVHVFWPAPGGQFTYFMMDAVRRMLGGPPGKQFVPGAEFEFDRDLALARMIIMYLCGNDFCPVGQQYKGISAAALCTVAFENDIPRFVRSDGKTATIDAELLAAYLRHLRVTPVKSIDGVWTNESDVPETKRTNVQKVDDLWIYYSKSTRSPDIEPTEELRKRNQAAVRSAVQFVMYLTAHVNWAETFPDSHAARIGATPKTSLPVATPAAGSEPAPTTGAAAAADTNAPKKRAARKHPPVFPKPKPEPAAAAAAAPAPAEKKKKSFRSTPAYAARHKYQPPDLFDGWTKNHDNYRGVLSSAATATVATPQPVAAVTSSTAEIFMETVATPKAKRKRISVAVAEATAAVQFQVGESIDLLQDALADE